MASLTESQLYELHERLIPITWVLRIWGIREKDEIETYATAFSITTDGTILTCAHSFKGVSIRSIHARALDENDFTHEVQILFSRSSWDIILLKVVGVSGGSSGVLALNGSLYEGETLLYIGNPHNFVGSFLIGYAAYQCTEDVDLPTGSGGCTCADYNSKALAVTPRYRVLGHVWNESAFEILDKDRYAYERNLDPMVPIIQAARLNCEVGCSGGPVFNTQGEVVGMLIGSYSDYDIALHVTIIQEFLKLFSEAKGPPCTTVDLKGKGQVHDGVEKKNKR